MCLTFSFTLPCLCIKSVKLRQRCRGHLTKRLWSIFSVSKWRTPIFVARFVTILVTWQNWRLMRQQWRIASRITSIMQLTVVGWRRQWSLRQVMPWSTLRWREAVRSLEQQQLMGIKQVTDWIEIRTLLVCHRVWFITLYNTFIKWQSSSSSYVSGQMEARYLPESGYLGHKWNAH